MTKEEKIVLALSLIEQTRKDVQTVAKSIDESLVTRMETNLQMVGDLITGKYNALPNGREVTDTRRGDAIDRV